MSSTPQSSTGNSALDFTIATISALVGKTVGSIPGAPFQRAKILLQTQHIIPQLAGEKAYKGYINALVRIPKEEGVLAYWRGNFPHIIRTIPMQASNFLLNDTFKRILNPYNPRTDFEKFFAFNMLAGGLAGATSLLFVYPLDVARTRLAADVGRTVAERQFKGTMDVFKQSMASGGVRSLYKGFMAPVAGIFVYRSFYFAGYDLAKRTILSDPKSGYFLKFAIAQAVTVMAGVMSYPLDTVMRRCMMQASQKEILYKGVIDCIGKMYREEGIRGYFRGCLGNIMIGFGSALSLVLYDELQRSFNRSDK